MNEHPEADYRDAFGIIVICMHCRKTRRNASKGQTWELVEAFTGNRPKNVSDGLCPECLDKHYPAK
jgi:hypothetical protein